MSPSVFAELGSRSDGESDVDGLDGLSKNVQIKRMAQIE